MSEIEIKPRRGSAFRHFFLRGLAIILPTVLTIWLLVIAYTFVYDKIAYPINWGVQELVLRLTDGPPVSEKDYAEALQDLSAGQQAELGDRLSALGPDCASSLSANPFSTATRSHGGWSAARPWNAGGAGWPSARLTFSI